MHPPSKVALHQRQMLRERKDTMLVKRMNSEGGPTPRLEGRYKAVERILEHQALAMEVTVSSSRHYSSSNQVILSPNMVEISSLSHRLALLHMVSRPPLDTSLPTPATHRNVPLRCLLPWVALLKE